MLALEGIKILDFRTATPGAFCTMILGDLGTEVIKVDVPPGASRLGAGPVIGEAKRVIAYQTLVRNKKSIALKMPIIGLYLTAERSGQVIYESRRSW